MAPLLSRRNGWPGSAAATVSRRGSVLAGCQPDSEELEAWFFGEWASVRSAYPRVPPKLTSQAAYRNPDAIKGGTWEALERILTAAGYFSLGLRKTEIAGAIGRRMNPDAKTSPSFACFRTAVLAAVTP